MRNFPAGVSELVNKQKPSRFKNALSLAAYSAGQAGALFVLACFCDSMRTAIILVFFDNLLFSLCKIDHLGEPGK
jgi:hypothetical protein